MRSYILVYDADCGMCTRFRNIVEFLDTYRNICFAAIDHAEQNGLLDSLPDAVRHRSFHLVLPGGHVESGAQALPKLIRLLPGGGLVSRLIISTPIGPDLLGFFYSMVARRHEAGMCKMQNSPCPVSSKLDDLAKGAKSRTAALLGGMSSDFAVY